MCPASHDQQPRSQADGLKRRVARPWAAIAFAGLVTAVATVAAIVGALPSAGAASPTVAVFPIPGGRLAAPTTQLTFRGLPISQLGSIMVTGAKSGPHSGILRSDSDGMGGSYFPIRPFIPGERVTVRTSLNIAGATDGSYSFTIARPTGRIRAAGLPPLPRVRGDVWRYASRPDLLPASVRLTRPPSRQAAPGDLFVASQKGPVQSGPELLGPYGGLIWFRPVPRSDSATDFREQTYRGNPVLTWWQGVVNAAGVGFGMDEIYDSSYRPLATVQAGNGLRADLHEFQLTPQNTALITAYYPVYWNASAIRGASRHEIVLDSVVQEIDIPTGLVLFQWDSLDHVALGASHQSPPAVKGHPWDYFHVNSVQPLSDGNLLISARNTWAAYKVSHQTARIEWTLGGKRSSFRMGRGAAFAFQHDVRPRSGNLVTLFDDGSGPPVIHRQSRALTLRLDLRHMRATVARQEVHRPPLLANYEGNVQRLADGDDFVGWGQLPYLTEFNSRGREDFEAQFVGNTDSYRAYRFNWTATPTTLPAIALRVRGGRRTVWVSWNGATRVARWRLLGGNSSATLKPIGSARKTAFETGIRLAHAYRYVEAEALDRNGTPLATSRPIRG